MFVGVILHFLYVSEITLKTIKDFFKLLMLWLKGGLFRRLLVVQRLPTHLIGVSNFLIWKSCVMLKFPNLEVRTNSEYLLMRDRLLIRIEARKLRHCMIIECTRVVWLWHQNAESRLLVYLRCRNLFGRCITLAQTNNLFSPFTSHNIAVAYSDIYAF